MSTDVQIRIRRLAHGRGLDLPDYESSGAAGMDLRAAIADTAPVMIAPGRHAIVPTGLEMEIPHGFEGQVRPRSGLAARHGVTILNAPGTIDSDYRGEVKVILVNLGGEPFEVRRGARIAQLVIAPIARAELEMVDSLTVSARGAGGFGSTGAA